MTWAAHVERVPPDWEAADPEWERRRFGAPESYFPKWPMHLRTHWQWWQSKTDPTPVSPTFATPEELATYLIENKTRLSFVQWYNAYRGDHAAITKQIVEEAKEFTLFDSPLKE